MAMKSLKNQYRGINAHLHSICQNPGDSPTIWTSFHVSYISCLSDALNSQLPLDYVARLTPSLQLWIENKENEYQQSGAAQYHSKFSYRQSAAIADPSVRVISLEDLLVEESFEMTSVVIYHAEEHTVLGRPVTRIELLSTGNKAGKPGNVAYLHNRMMALQSGTSLIELDYLHQTPSPLPKMPAYPRANDSHAYTIAITDERDGQNLNNVMLVYVRDVDIPLPEKVSIPLAGAESITFDFDRVYQYTFETGRWGSHIDYELPPRNVETYSPDDQERIKSVMKRAAAEIPST